ncbi:MAG TPA: FAD-dependent oxidoreductase [Anaerolineales bacterium]|nr:FAD-dependent oxidoreductase [Anaerolineales bacterium]
MRYVIVGASAAGLSAAQAIRKRDPTAAIQILSAEARPPYYRPLIPYLITGEKGEAELLREPRWLPPEIDLRLGLEATALRPESRQLTLAGGETLAYDCLLLATGAEPILPDVPGLRGPGVFTLRAWEDALGIAVAAREAALHGSRQAIVLGAGRIGMKSAFALRNLDFTVTVVELLDRLVPQQLDAEGSAIFAETVARAGIQVILGSSLSLVERRAGQIVGVQLNDGRRLTAGLLVVGVGVRPKTELARSGGLKMGAGLLVDEGLRTSAPEIYAAGDVVETVDIASGRPFVSGIWTNAVEMGRIAGDNMAGGSVTFPGAFNLLNAMELGGLPVISVGDIHAGDGAEVFSERRGQNYRKLVFRDNRLVGLVLVGAIERAGVYQSLIRTQAEVSALRRELLGPRFHYGHYLHARPQEVDRYILAG